MTEMDDNATPAMPQCFQCIYILIIIIIRMIMRIMMMIMILFCAFDGGVRKFIPLEFPTSEIHQLSFSYYEVFHTMKSERLIAGKELKGRKWAKRQSLFWQHKKSTLSIFGNKKVPYESI